MRKKFTAIITILAMIFTIIPAGAYADGGEPVTLTGSDGNVKGYYKTLDQAADMAENGDVISLNDDITMAYYQKGGSKIKPTMNIENKSIILDGNNHTVTANTAEAFHMITVKETGKLIIKNITMDGARCDNRSFSCILNIDGGEVTMEDNTILKNNATAAVDIGINAKKGKFIMNGGIITENHIIGGSNDTGAAVTVLDNSVFIMNGGTIKNNESSEKYGSSGVMVNRGASAELNGGVIENNNCHTTLASALHIKSGNVIIKDTIIRNNISDRNVPAIYVNTGELILNGTYIKDKEKAITLANNNNVNMKVTDTPEITGKVTVYATSDNFNCIKADSTLNPVNPIEIDVKNEYVKGQKIVEYTSGTPEPENFVTSDSDYCFVKSEDEKFLEIAENEGYEITATSGKNGTISPSGVIKVKKGESRTFTFIPEDGYTVDSVFVDGKNCGNIPSYTFTAVDKNHTISVSFKEKEKEPPIIVYPEITSIDPIPDQIYTGDEIKPSLTVRDQYGEVIEPNNYIVEYSENIEAGIAEVKVTGKAGVLKSAETTFRIVLSDYDMISGSQLKINKVKSDFGRIRVYFDRIKIGDRKIHYQIVSQKIGSEKKKIQYATIGYDYSTVRNLEYNRIYNIKIRAYFKDENGKRYYSPWSEEVQCYSNRLGNANQVMYRPSITKLTAGKTSVAVDLKKVEFKKDPVKITYQIAYKKKGATKFSYAYTTNLKKTVYNLSKNTKYQFKVRYYYKSLVDNKLVFSPYTVLKTVKTAR